MHKKSMGSLGEHLVITECLKQGISVFKDVGDNCKFDLVISDKMSSLYKVQVKYYTRKKNITTVYFTKSGPNYKFIYGLHDVDYFAVVDDQTEMIAWIRYKDFIGTKTLSLRHGDVVTNGVTSAGLKMFVNFVEFPFSKRNPLSRSSVVEQSADNR